MKTTVKTILYCATVDYHFKAFHLPEMKWFKSQGWDVHVAAAGNIELPYTDKQFPIAIQRSPLKWKNMVAYRQLKAIIRTHDYQLIHAHTPLGGVLARLTARKARKNGTSVLYTAHGFHFCKGAPIVNWLLYYPMERYLARYTDTLVTINDEDFQLATSHRFKAKSITQMNGIGVDTERFHPLNETNKQERKHTFGYKPDDFLLFYAAEFNENKNQRFLLYVMSLLKQTHPNIKLLLAGEGRTMTKCQDLVNELGLHDVVVFLGFQKELEKLLPVCDLAIASSIREGLPVNIMEAMACGLAVVASDNRGHRELIQNGQNGWVLGNYKPDLFATRVKILVENKRLRLRFGKESRKKIQAKYSLNKVMQKKQQMYGAYMKGGEKVWKTH